MTLSPEETLAMCKDADRLLRRHHAGETLSENNYDFIMAFIHTLTTLGYAVAWEDDEIAYYWLNEGEPPPPILG